MMAYNLANNFCFFFDIGGWYKVAICEYICALRHCGPIQEIFRYKFSNTIQAVIVFVFCLSLRLAGIVLSIFSVWLLW